jgi:hypothetical protein
MHELIRKELVNGREFVGVREVMQPDDPDEVLLLTFELQSEIEGHRARKRRGLYKFGGGMLLALLAALLTGGPNGFLPWFMVFGSIAGAGAVSGSREQLEAAVTRVRSPRAINILAIACRDGDRDTRAVAAKGLRRLLPQLKPEDARHISTEGMQALLKLLDRPDGLLAIPILKALEQVGDVRAIPMVQRITSSMKPASFWKMISLPENEWWQVQNAARECLPYLQARQEKERLRGSLLRPSDETGPPSDSLLRAAQPTPPEMPAQLLRPANGLNDDDRPATT